MKVGAPSLRFCRGAPCERSPLATNHLRDFARQLLNSQLSQDDHPSCTGEIFSGEHVKVYAVCHLLAELVSAIPVDSSVCALVEPRDPMSNFQHAYHTPAPVKDCQSNI